MISDLPPEHLCDEIRQEVKATTTAVLVYRLNVMAADGELGVYRQEVCAEAARRLATPHAIDFLTAAATHVDPQDARDEREMADEAHLRRTTTTFDGENR